MRVIERTSRFKRDYKREARGRYRMTLDADLKAVVSALADDRALKPRHYDHALTGDWKDHRDCHIRPDLVPVSRKTSLKRHEKWGLPFGSSVKTAHNPKF